MTRKWFVLAAATVPVLDALFASHAHAAIPIKLNGNLIAGGIVNTSGFTPDSSRVLYNASQNTAGIFELFSVLSGGGMNVRLNANLIAGGQVVGFEGDLRISADSSRVVYVADQNVNDVFELFSVPTAGGVTPTRLNGTLAAGGDVAPGITTEPIVYISNDSTRVSYIADQNADEVYELFGVPIGGGTAVKLNGALTAGGDVYSKGFTPDSSRAIYVADQNADEVFELFSAPSAGGVAPTKLSGNLVSGGDVGIAGVLVSPDSSRVVYMADAQNNDVFELFSVPSAGAPTPTKLNGAFFAGSDVIQSSFAITPDSTRVTYIADQNTDGVNELYSVPITGGATTKLNGALTAGGNVLSSYLTPNGSRIVYVADQNTDEVVELYSVPVTGGSAVKLNGTLVPGGQLRSLVLTPDSNRLIYTADQDTGGVIELYSVPLTGGTPLKIAGGFAVGGVVANELVTPDSTRVVYQAIQTATSPIELYLVGVLGGQPVKVNAPMVTGGNVTDFSISPDGSRVLFRADANSDGVFEIFIRYIEDKWKSAAGDWDSPANWNNNVSPDEVMKTSITGPANVLLAGASTRSAWSLQVGGGTGSSIVQLQGSAGLSVANGLTIASGGVVRGDGLVVADVINQAGGEVRAGAGDKLRFSGNSFSSAGRIEAIGGGNPAEIEFGSPLTNLSTGSINASNAILRFNSGLTNQGTVTISSGNNSVFGAVNNSAASKVIVTGGATTTFYGPVSSTAGSEFRVSNGVAVFLGAVTGTANFTGGGLKIFESTASPGPIATVFGDTTVTSTGHLTATYIREDALTVQGTASITPNGTAASVSRVNALSITGGQLDLADNDLIVDATSLTTIRSFIVAGFNNGSWNGNGLASSSAAISGAHKTALGYASASSINVSTFDGQAVSGAATLVRYTLSGDANLDGVVNALDFNALATNFGATGKFWFNGDFNFDGTVNSPDFNAIATNFGLTVPGDMPTKVGSPVPEPTLVAPLGALLLRRHRRRLHLKS